MASPTLTELFDFTPYPRPKPGRELEAEVATNGAARLSSLLSAIEFLCWGGGSSNPVATPAERLRQQHAAKFEAGYAARQGDDELLELVLRRCPGLVDVLNVMATAWPGPGETVADDLVRPGAGERATDAAVEAMAVIITALRAQLTMQPWPRPRLPGALTVLALVSNLNVDDAARVAADTAALDEAAREDLGRAELRKMVRATASRDDELLRGAEGAALIMIDRAAAYANRRETDPEMSAVLQRLVDAVFKLATPTIKTAAARDVAEVQLVVEAAYARVRSAADDLGKVLREEAARFSMSRLVFACLDEFVIPIDDSDPQATRADGEPVSIAALGGPKRAASTMVKAVFGSGVGARTTLEERVDRWRGATKMTAFGVAPNARDRLRYACGLVTTSDDDAELIFNAALKAAVDAGWFFWREASPVSWG
jgi:hypothetical protein